MNRLFTILCVVSLLVFHTSCDDSVMDLESLNVEIKTRAAEQRVQNLIQQVRQGDVEACKSLAICYRDGDGVGRSWFNMVSMYSIYCKRSGGNIENVVELLDEGHPFRLLFNVFDSVTNAEILDARVKQLKNEFPVEAKVAEEARKMASGGDPQESMEIIKEAELEGSEIAVIFQILHYKETDDLVSYEETLLRSAGKYPILNNELAWVNLQKYHNSNDYAHILKAMEYYYKADEYGMLTPKYAFGLLHLYYYLSNKGVLEPDNEEISRLNRLSHIIYPL